MLFFGRVIPVKLEAAPKEKFLCWEEFTQKWLVSCSCNPEKSNKSKHHPTLRINLDLYSTESENFRFFIQFYWMLLMSRQKTRKW